jgi:predicted short-subunit dehydrogenase-like oxidoreductase (DUF2520 family)
VNGVATVRVVGAGRAGGALATALGRIGWPCDVLGRDAEVGRAADGVDLLVLAVPDGSIAAVAASVEPVASTVVAHLAGSLGLDVLAPHARRAAVHPLLALPNAAVGADRLLGGAWFAVAGDAIAEQLVAALGGRSFTVEDRDRAAYHAAAVIASNHLVALLDQVSAVAPLGVPFDAYLDLVRSTVENVAALGPVAALTGPAARGDAATIERHLAALAPAERALYEVLAARCAHMAGR